jgi:hypothetical protein
MGAKCAYNFLFGGKMSCLEDIIGNADDDALDELSSKSLCDFWTPCPETLELPEGALGLLLPSTADARWDCLA